MRTSSSPKPFPDTRHRQPSQPNRKTPSIKIGPQREIRKTKSPHQRTAPTRPALDPCPLGFDAAPTNTPRRDRQPHPDQPTHASVERQRVRITLQNQAAVTDSCRTQRTAPGLAWINSIHDSAQYCWRSGKSSPYLHAASVRHRSAGRPHPHPASAQSDHPAPGGSAKTPPSPPPKAPAGVYNKRFKACPRSRPSRIRDFESCLQPQSKPCCRSRFHTQPAISAACILHPDSADPLVPPSSSTMMNAPMPAKRPPSSPHLRNMPPASPAAKPRQRLHRLPHAANFQSQLCRQIAQRPHSHPALISPAIGRSAPLNPRFSISNSSLQFADNLFQQHPRPSPAPDRRTKLIHHDRKSAGRTFAETPATNSTINFVSGTTSMSRITCRSVMPRISLFAPQPLR